MRTLKFGVFVMISLVSCAMAPKGGENPIVGKWIGSPVPIVLVFEKNQKVKLGEDPGEWSFENGKYLIRGEGEPKDSMWSGTIDAKGRLVIEDAEKSEGDGEKLIFRREEVVKRAEAPLSVQESAAVKKALDGEWRFACVRKSMFSLAPPFDIMFFNAQGKIQTTSTLVSKKMEGDYTSSGDNLKLTKLGPARTTNELKVRLEDNGDTLVIKPKGQKEPYGAEWMHLRPSQFLPNEIAGKWINQETGGPYYREMELRKDGRLIIVVVDAKNGKIVKTINGNKGYDYYRLWRSPVGKAMTTVFVNPEIGLQSITMKYERKDDTLIVTPIVWVDVDEKFSLESRGKEIWKKKKD